jgi:hypothetical protein
MAHFAQLDENNLVTQVIVVNNAECLDEQGNESEVVGAAFCNSLFAGRWVKTSYNGTIRKNYAGIGYEYDEQRNAFIPPKPFNSWTLNDDTCLWQAPIPMPQDGKKYLWNESSLAWDIVPEIQITE